LSEQYGVRLAQTGTAGSGADTTGANTGGKSDIPDANVAQSAVRNAAPLEGEPREEAVTPEQGALFARTNVPDTSGIEVGDVDQMTTEEQAQLAKLMAAHQADQRTREDARLEGLSPDQFLVEAYQNIAQHNEAFQSPKVAP
jgi:Asp-tRNA(Asn)/Glu-tRNA(Gln) amidotransferase C subunit